MREYFFPGRYKFPAISHQYKVSLPFPYRKSWFVSFSLFTIQQIAMDLNTKKVNPRASPREVQRLLEMVRNNPTSNFSK